MTGAATEASTPHITDEMADVLAQRRTEFKALAAQYADDADRAKESKKAMDAAQAKLNCTVDEALDGQGQLFDTGNDTGADADY